MSGAARKARKKAGVKYVKPQKTPTVRYTEQGKAVHGLPPAMSLEEWQRMLAASKSIIHKMGVAPPSWLN